MKKTTLQKKLTSLIASRRLWSQLISEVKTAIALVIKVMQSCMTLAIASNGIGKNARDEIPVQSANKFVYPQH